MLADLVRRGVTVTVYRHQAAGFPLLVEAAEAGVVVVEQSGYVGFAPDEATAEAVRRRLFSNLVP